MEITVSTQNGRVPVTIMHIEGDIDTRTAGAFEAKADELIQGGARHILVDLTRCTYMSSASLRALHQLSRKLNAIHSVIGSDGTQKSPYLKLLNASAKNKAVFTVSGFDLFLEFYDDLGRAVAAF